MSSSPLLPLDAQPFGIVRVHVRKKLFARKKTTSEGFRFDIGCMAILPVVSCAF